MLRQIVEHSVRAWIPCLSYSALPAVDQNIEDLTGLTRLTGFLETGKDSLSQIERPLLNLKNLLNPVNPVKKHPAKGIDLFGRAVLN